MYIVMIFFFFFSSRRRHTRFDCDWSSDVCSSDLASDSAPAMLPMSRNALARMSWPANAVSREASARSEEHTSELQSQSNLVCRLLLEKKKNTLYQLFVCARITQRRARLV